MKKLRVLSLVLIVFVGGFVLTSCGKKNENQSENGALPAKMSSCQDDSNNLTVSIDITSNPNYKKYLDQIVPKFEKDNNTKVTIVDKGQTDVKDQMPTAGPACKAPDVFVQPYNDAAVLMQAGHIFGVNLPNDQFSEQDITRSTYDGKLTGSPLTIETLLLYYNKNLIPDAPKTFDDLQKLSTDSKFSYKGKNIAFLSDWTNFYITYGVLKAYGAYIFGSNDTDPSDIGLNNQGAVDAAKYLKDTWYNIWPADMQSNKIAPQIINSLFTSGKAGAVISGPWDKQNFTTKNVNLGAVSLPTLPNGKEFSPFAGGKEWVASTYSKNPKLAQAWITYVSSADTQKAFYTASGEIPANLTAREEVKNSGDPVDVAVIDTYKNATPMPTIVAMNQVWDPMAQAFVDIATGKSDPQTALDNQVKVIKSQIASASND
jgi:arabinogalactan oligomer/maltooligosaccharide transport system substrate-binding protein